MIRIPVRDEAVRATVADLRATFPDAYISVRPSAQLGYATIDVYPEG